METIQKLFATKRKGYTKFINIIGETKEVKDNPNSWHKALQDASITRQDILEYHEFTNNKTLHPSFHDQKFRLLSRKTQFNNQLSKHTDTPPFCELWQNELKVETKETLIHALWDCPKVNNLHLDTIKHLEVDHLTQLPLSAQQVILHDSFTAAPTFMNSVWLLIICSILSARHNNKPLDYISLSRKVKSEIKATNKSYPHKKLGNECRYLSLSEFLASYEAEGFHRTTHKTSSNL